MKKKNLVLILVLTVLLTSLFALSIVSAQDNSDVTISPNYVIYCPYDASGDGRHLDMSSERRVLSINGEPYNCRYWKCTCGTTLCTLDAYGAYYFNPATANYVFKLTPWGGYEQYYDEPTLIHAGPDDPVDWLIQSW